MFVLLIFVVLQDAAAPDASAAAKKDVEAMAGNWKITRLEAGGQPSVAAFIEKLTFVITADTLTLTDGKHDETTKYKLNAGVTPKQIDIIAQRKQADGSVKEQVAPGIYELSGDVLKICFVKDGARPAAFASKANDPSVLMELKRQPKQP
jgi:uncharacterized protein (TIGR03067 family)